MNGCVLIPMAPTAGLVCDLHLRCPAYPESKVSRRSQFRDLSVNKSLPYKITPREIMVVFVLRHTMGVTERWRANTLRIKVMLVRHRVCLRSSGRRAIRL